MVLFRLLICVSRLFTWVTSLVTWLSTLELRDWIWVLIRPALFRKLVIELSA